MKFNKHAQRVGRSNKKRNISHFNNLNIVKHKSTIVSLYFKVRIVKIT